MLRLIGRNRPGVVGGVLAFLAFVTAQLVVPGDWLNILRERGFDAVLTGDLHLRYRFAPADRPRVVVVVVDIDQRTIAALGDWPWPRETMAQLVNAVADAKPRAVAIDVLFAGLDTRSPAALARRLDGVAHNSSTYELAASALVDGDQQLASAVASASTALGFTLDTSDGHRGHSVAVLRRGPVMLGDVWRAPGATEPLAPLSEGAA